MGVPLVHDPGAASAAPVPVPIDRIRPGFPLRVGGASEKHVAALAEAAEQLPPIVVHRPTMRVVDGRHRLLAAQARGVDRIQVQYVDGDEDSSLVLAVRLNARHGLPLSRRDRAAAVTRFLGVHPEWSDRRIAALVGVAHTTVGAARRRSTGVLHQSDGSIGRDGRLRPRNIAERRERAVALLAARPEASSREIARSVGLCSGTVIDVRRREASRAAATARVVHGRRPAAGRSPAPAPAGEPEVPPAGGTDSIRTLGALRTDPSLRYSAAGRSVLRLLAAGLAVRDLEDVAAAVPEHARVAVARLCRDSANEWLRVADALDSPAGLGCPALLGPAAP